MNNLSLFNIILSSIPCRAITILLKIYIKSSIVDTSLYSSKKIYLISIFIITSILLYIVPIRDFFNNSSLVIKLRATNNYTYSSNIDICSFL